MQIIEPQTTEKPGFGYRYYRNKFKQEGLLKLLLPARKQAGDEAPETSTSTEDSNSHSKTHSSTLSSQQAAHFEDDYQLGKMIGQGANAVVKHCRRKKDGAVFAVKISSVEEEHLLYLRRLFNRIAPLRHPNIIHYHALYIDLARRSCHLVMEFLEHPTLGELIYGKEEEGKKQHDKKQTENPEVALPISEPEVKEIMRQLLETLRFLHSRGICHRDVKADNILMDRGNGRIWLIDYGVSKLMIERGIRRQMYTNTGTCEYKAPEIYAGGRYNENVDLWAAGVLMFELIQKRLPFHREYLSETIQSILDGDYQEGPVWKHYSKHAHDLLHRLLKPNYKRLSAKEALGAPWFFQEVPHNIISVSSESDLLLSSQQAPKDREEGQEGDRSTLTVVYSPVLMARRKSKRCREAQTATLQEPEEVSSVDFEMTLVDLREFKPTGNIFLRRIN